MIILLDNMNYLFEKTDSLNAPFECFFYDVEKLEAERKSFPVRPHWHYFMEIIYVNSGTAEMRVGNTSVTSHAGDLVLFQAKAVHSIDSHDPASLKFSVIKVDINRLVLPSDYAPKLRSIFRSAEQRGMTIHFGAEAARQMDAQALFRSCIDEMNTQNYGYDVIIRSCIFRLLVNILRSWQENGFTIDSDVFAEDSVYDIYSITEYIGENLSRGIRVAEIAEMCGMSYSYFAKRFQQIYGKTCKEYIEEMRIKKAQEFLIFTDFDLNYISQETGFSDCSHLIKTFKRHTGVTPKQFRMGEKIKIKA